MSDDDRDNDIESDADKRAHHNALERKRRDHIKDSFSMLRDALPYFQGDKELFGLNATEIKKKQKISNRNLEARASRAQILKKAADYITSMRRKNTAHQQDIDDLKRQNKALEEQIRMLEKNRTPDAIASANTAMESAVKTIKNISMSTYNPSEYADSSESEDSSDNSRDSSDSPRKRLKTDPARI